MCNDWTDGLYNFILFKKAKEEYEEGNVKESAKTLNKIQSKN